MRLWHWWCWLFHGRHWVRAEELDGLDFRPYFGYHCKKCDRDHLLYTLHKLR